MLAPLQQEAPVLAKTIGAKAATRVLMPDAVVYQGKVYAQRHKFFVKGTATSLFNSVGCRSCPYIPYILKHLPGIHTMTSACYKQLDAT